jgi:hypothetical protein
MLRGVLANGRQRQMISYKKIIFLIVIYINELVSLFFKFEFKIATSPRRSCLIQLHCAVATSDL